MITKGVKRVAFIPKVVVKPEWVPKKAWGMYAADGTLLLCHHKTHKHGVRFI